MKRALSEDLRRLVRSKIPAKLLGVAVSAVILLLLYQRLDRRAIGYVLSSADKFWLVTSVAMIVPITLLNAVRFRWVAGGAPRYIDALALTVISNALNLFLPAKLGDLAKSRFLFAKHKAAPGVAVSVVVYERLCDVYAVTTWCLLGWLSGLAPANINAAALVASALWLMSGALLLSGGAASSLLNKAKNLHFLKKRERLMLLVQGWPALLSALGQRSKWLVVFSEGLWFIHLTQIWLFFLAVNATVPFLASLALSPVVLLAALIPFTLGGIGPRDAAIVYLFSAYVTPEAAAAVGLLTITRAIVPAVAAVPFMRRSLDAVFESP